MRNVFTAILLAFNSSMTNRVLKFPVLFMLVLAAVWSAHGSRAKAEVRTLNLHFAHTGESLVVTYKKDGRYIPSAMAKINYFLRDWRAKKVKRIDPVTIDLLWELYADLGAKKPAEIISGYRSPRTNAMLRRIGRKTARFSQHMNGKAIDVYFPDVPLARLRGSALVRQVGGVGYYPRSGKYGFVHIDSGSVRHWPHIPATRMARIFRDYRKTIGARRYRRNTPATTLVASATSRGPRNILPARVAKPVSASAAVTSNPPLPRPRPLAVMMAAVAADATILPVSAPVPVRNFGARPSLVRDDIASVIASNTTQVQHSNTAAKQSFAVQVGNGNVASLPLIRPLQASTSANAIASQYNATPEQMVRRDGAPQSFTMGHTGSQVMASGPSELTGKDKSALASMIAALTGHQKPAPVQTSVTSGKSDRLVVNRARKGDMLIAPRYKRTSARLMPGQNRAGKLAANLEAVLKSADKPLGFGNQ